MPGSRRRAVLLACLGCVLGLASSPAEAASAIERDQHLLAIETLVERGIRASADRQINAFAFAGYPDGARCEQALRWIYAGRFRTDEPDAEVAAALEQAFDRQRTAMEAMATKPEVPESLRLLIARQGSPLVRLVNEAGRMLNPNAPPPLTGVAPGGDRLARLLVQVGVESRRAFDLAVAEVDRFERDREPLFWDLSESDPRYRQLAQEGTMLRFAAVKPLYLAHIVLREAVTRGKAFGVDPDVAGEWLRVLLKEHALRLAEWDFAWGDHFLPLKAQVNALLGEAVRQQVSGVSADDVEAEFERIIDADPKSYPQQVRHELVGLKLLAFAHLLRWHLELGTSRDHRRAAELWERLVDRQADWRIALDGTSESSATLAQCYVLAARSRAAQHDVGGATSLLAEVVGAARNPLASHARQWIAFLDRGADRGSEWGARPVPMDPDRALTIAAAFLSQAASTPDVEQARGMYMRAAISLRSGILGLAGATFASRFVATAPRLYDRYAFALYRQGLHLHAAVAATEGLRAIAPHVTKRGHPWKKGGQWTASGEHLHRLVQNALAFASTAYSRTRSSGARSLYDDAITLVKRISPDDAGQGLERNQIAFKLSEGDFAEAYRLIDAYRKEYPAESLWVFEVLTQARMRHADLLLKESRKDPSQKQRLDEVTRALVADAEQLAGSLRSKAERTPEEERALASAIGASVFQAMQQGRYDAVMAQLGPDYWRQPPRDQETAARMMKMLCLAAFHWTEAMVAADATQAVDAQRVSDVIVPIYERFQRKHPRWTKPSAIDEIGDGARALAAAFQRITVRADAERGDRAKPWEGLAALARRAIADLIEPTLDASADPKLMTSIADLLWGMEERPRAARLYRLVLDRIEGDDEAMELRHSPAAVLDPVEELIASRLELAPAWRETRDLLEDRPGLLELRRQGLDPDQWGERPIDYHRAVTAIRQLREALDGLRSVLGADRHGAMREALDGLGRRAMSLAQGVRISLRLARAYREQGDHDQARRLYAELLTYDPQDPEIASAFVDSVLARVKAGDADERQVREARSVAITHRDGPGATDPVLFWTAQVQILELSVALADLEPVRSALRRLTATESDLSRDLVRPGVRGDDAQPGDHAAVRRARDALAVELGERYLALFAAAGVDVPPPFRIERIVDDERTWMLFVDADAPAMEARQAIDAHGDPVLIFVTGGGRADP